MAYKKLFFTLSVWHFVLAYTANGKEKPPQNNDLKIKYQQAVHYYQAQKYNKASERFEEILPLLKGKKEVVSIHFYQAYCTFYQHHYLRSADHFRYFYSTYPNASQVEEAMYMQGYALSLLSPDVKLDQAVTQEAIQAFKNYLEQYPEGSYSSDATKYLAVLNSKLARKAFNNAKLYHQLAHYHAAVIALKNFQKEFPHTVLQEKAAYLQIDAQYQLAKTCNQQAIQRNRLQSTLTYCHHFLAKYPNSKYKQAIEKIYQKSLPQIIAS